MSQHYLERRRHPRISAALRVRISTIDPERDPWTGKPFFRASSETCANLSRGGAFIHTREPLAPGRRLLLEIELPDHSSLEAIGRVAWTKRVMTPREQDQEAGIGIEFLGGAEDQFTAFHSYLEKQIDV
jgi:Tfp pilus assembly protein PilZ